MGHRPYVDRVDHIAVSLSLPRHQHASKTAPLRTVRSVVARIGAQIGGPPRQCIAARNLCIQPTIIIHPGWPLRIIGNKDMVLRPYRDLGVIR